MLNIIILAKISYYKAKYTYLFFYILLYIYVCFVMRYVSPKLEKIEVLEAKFKSSNNIVGKSSQRLLLLNQGRMIIDPIGILMLTEKDNFDT